MASSSKTKYLAQACQEVKVTDFLDYAEFLKAVYLHLKKSMNRYSYEAFSSDLGLGMGNVSFLICTKKRKLTQTTAARVIRALDLNGYERRYFSKLVKYQNSSDPLERDAQFKSLTRFKGKTVSEEAHDMLEFFSAWQHAVVFEMLELVPKIKSLEEFHEKFRVPITKERIKESLELLVKLGVAQKIGTDAAGNSEYVKVRSDVDLGDEVEGLGIVAFHSCMIDFAKDALTRIEANEREISSVTLAVSEEVAQELIELVREFREKLMLAAKASADKKKVVQVNIQLFPIAS